MNRRDDDRHLRPAGCSCPWCGHELSATEEDRFRCVKPECERVDVEREEL